jgi:hypothetical protein
MAMEKLLLRREDRPATLTKTLTSETLTA